MTRNEIDTVLNEFVQYAEAPAEARDGFALALADAFLDAQDIRYAWALYYNGWNRCARAYFPRGLSAHPEA